MDRICMHRFCPFEYKRSKYLVYLIDRNRLVTCGMAYQRVKTRDLLLFNKGTKKIVAKVPKRPYLTMPN